MSTALASGRSGIGLRNQDFQYWAGGVPVDYTATTTNADLVQLTRTMEGRYRAGRREPEVDRLMSLSGRPPFGDPITRGLHAVRFVATDSWTARSVGIRPENLNLDLSGTNTWGLPFRPQGRVRFQLWTRGTPGKQIELLLAVRDAVGTNPVYLNTVPATWSNTQTGLIITLDPIWRKHTFEFVPTLTADGVMAGQPVQDALVFGVENVSTADPANADPFFFDLSTLRYFDDAEPWTHEEA